MLEFLSNDIFQENVQNSGFLLVYFKVYDIFEKIVKKSDIFSYISKIIIILKKNWKIQVIS